MEGWPHYLWELVKVLTLHSAFSDTIPAGGGRTPHCRHSALAGADGDEAFIFPVMFALSRTVTAEKYLSGWPTLIFF